MSSVNAGMDAETNTGENGDNIIGATSVKGTAEQEGCCSCGHWKNAHPFNSSYGIKFLLSSFF